MAELIKISFSLLINAMTQPPQPSPSKINESAPASVMRKELDVCIER